MVSGKKKKKPFPANWLPIVRCPPLFVFQPPSLLYIWSGCFWVFSLVFKCLFSAIFGYIKVYWSVFTSFRLISTVSFVFIYFWLFSSVFGWEIVPISSEKSTCMRDIFPSSPFLLHISHYCPYFISIFCVFVGVFE